MTGDGPLDLAGGAARRRERFGGAVADRPPARGHHEADQGQIERAKAALHIAYGHTSHGSQLTDGMSGWWDSPTAGGKGLALPANAFAWNNGGSGGALDLHDYAMGGDVGYYPDWVVCTTNYLERSGQRGRERDHLVVVRADERQVFGGDADQRVSAADGGSWSASIRT
jgi:hypothetical protein